MRVISIFSSYIKLREIWILSLNFQNQANYILNQVNMVSEQEILRVGDPEFVPFFSTSHLKN